MTPKETPCTTSRCSTSSENSSGTSSAQPTGGGVSSRRRILTGTAAAPVIYAAAADPEVRAAFWAKVQRRSEGECWPWTGSHNAKAKPYGTFFIPGRYAKVYAHRFAYIITAGQLADSALIDHVAERGCTDTLCCNPAHLEPVTNRENLMRAGIGARNAEHNRRRAAASTGCRRGHEYALFPPEVWVSPTGARKRKCRECTRARLARQAVAS